MDMDLGKLTEIHGEVQELLSPSGFVFVIRMQTGEDDDTLSNAKWSLDGSSMNKFISTIVVFTDFVEKGKLNLDDARNLKMCDRLFIMIASRIFSIGQTVKFTYRWPDGVEVEYEEDLGIYIWDYYNSDNPFPYKGSEEYFRERIPQHKGGRNSSRVLELTSGKSLTYEFMNGHSEKWLMSLTQERQTVNSAIISRGLKQKVNDKWVKVQNFRNFNPNEMMELRKDIEEFDPPLDLVTELTHPTEGTKVAYPIVASPDFFFPREI